MCPIPLAYWAAATWAASSVKPAAMVIGFSVFFSGLDSLFHAHNSATNANSISFGLIIRRSILWQSVFTFLP